MQPSASSFSRKKTQLGWAFLSTPGQSLWIAADLFLGSLAFLAASFLNPYYQGQVFSSEQLELTALYTVAFGVCAIGAGLFDRNQRLVPASFLPAALAAWGIALLVSLGTYQWILGQSRGRLGLFLGSLGCLLAVLFLHSALSLFARWVPYRVISLGPESPLLMKIINFCKDPSKNRHLHFVGRWEQMCENHSPSDWIGLLKKSEIDEIIVSSSASSDPGSVEFALLAMKEGIRITDDLSASMEIFEFVPSAEIETSWLLSAGLTPPRGGSYLVKRTIDICLALILILLLAPLAILIALLIKLTSPGPILYKQYRQGRYCVPFKIYKFRTMYADTDGPSSTLKGDARITPVGRLLRPTHLDELPQLWNILRNKMSFVGPRPESLSFAVEIRKKIPLYDFRHIVLPGMTGLSQIRVGYTEETISDTHSKLSHDLYYILKFHLLLDLAILIRTAFVLMKRSR